MAITLARMGPLKRLRYALEGAALRGLAGVVRRLPHRLMLGLADAVAWTLVRVMGEDKRVALANLDIAFGDARSADEKAVIFRAAVRNLCRTLVGLLWSPNVGRDNLDQFVLIDPVEEARVRATMAGGRGVIFITPHYGNWELSCLMLGYRGVPMTIVAEPTKNPALSALVNDLRSRSGHRVIEPKYAVLKLMKALARGEATAMVADVNGRRRRGGVWSDFFGLKVFNGSGLAELALRTNAAIIAGVGVPLPDGRVRVRLTGEITAPRTGDHAADVQALTDAYTRVVEGVIRDAPEHWLWTYKRWKRRPGPEQGAYPFYSRYQKV